MVQWRVFVVLLFVSVSLSGCIGGDDEAPAPASDATDDAAGGNNTTAPVGSEDVEKQREAFFENTTEVKRDPPPPMPPFNEISGYSQLRVQATGGVLHVPVRFADGATLHSIGFHAPGDLVTGNWALTLVGRDTSLRPDGDCRDANAELYSYVRHQEDGGPFSGAEFAAGDYDLYIHGANAGVFASLTFNEPDDPFGLQARAGIKPEPDVITPENRTHFYNVTYIETQLKENNGDGTHYTIQGDIPGARSGLFVGGFRVSASLWQDSFQATTSLGPADGTACYSEEVTGSADTGPFGQGGMTFRPEVVLMPGADRVWTGDAQYGSSFSAGGSAGAALFNYNGDFAYGPFWLDQGTGV